MVVILLLVMVSFADGHEAHVPFRDLNSCGLWLLQFHFENEVTFLLAVLSFFMLLLLDFVALKLVNVWNIDVHKLNWENHLVGLMGESDPLQSWHIVVKFFG